MRVLPSRVLGHLLCCDKSSKLLYDMYLHNSNAMVFFASEEPYPYSGGQSHDTSQSAWQENPGFRQLGTCSKNASRIAAGSLNSAGVGRFQGFNS
jgi:hypothetical protein